MGEIDSILIIQAVIIFVLLFIVFYIVKFNLSLRLSRRIGKYSIEALKEHQLSLLEGIYILYKKMIEWLSKILNKIKIVKLYSKRHEKLIDYLERKKPMDVVSNKV